MEKRIQECLNGREDSYIFPFLWLHGESHERLREEILAIKNAGLQEFCAESRPYEGFCKEQWWEDFGFILETAKELQMRVWLLDDRLFPTGYANGYLEAPERAHLRKKLVREVQCEAVGPAQKTKILVKERLEQGEELIRVVAYPHVGEEEQLDANRVIDLTDQLADGCVYWDVPEGIWRVCILVRTGSADGEAKFRHYIDMLNKESCQAMINAVYAPHYEHFKEYFGNTFRGFFSDEPGFLNNRGTYFGKLGIMFERYPWRNDLPKLIAQSCGKTEEEIRCLIPALWEDLGETTALIRMHYMDVITKLYNENFSYGLGNWCREHGVMYIGHVIEECNAHMRLNYGAGHYFRALGGQDMAGMDIVLMQIIPGLTENVHRVPLPDKGYASPKFYHYTLPKLAASHSHLQPLKKGRAMCEIFGAFGWGEGLPYMKQLADLMLVNGINHFVPHAFSPKEDDPDCPPHFYNGGRNQQYALFGELMGYMGRCAHALSGGIHQADVAVFYNAEGEWTGGKNQVFQEVCAELTRKLIDYDIVPYDILKDPDTTVKDGKLWINGEAFGALIISESEIMPYDRLECFAKLAKQGLPVIFTESLPVRSAEGNGIEALLERFECVQLLELSDMLREKQCCHLSFEENETPYLRYYHTKRGAWDLFMFSNDDIRHTLDTKIKLPRSGACVLYDPWENRCYQAEAPEGTLHLVLEKGNAVMILFGEDLPTDLPKILTLQEEKPLELSFAIDLKNAGEKEFFPYAQNCPCVDLTAPDCMPDFIGEIRYRTEFEIEEAYQALDLGDVGETAQVWINGHYLGTRINAPYRFRLEDALVKGKNELEIRVLSNSAHAKREPFTVYLQVPPTGVLGPITLEKYTERK